MTRFVSFNINGIRARQHQLEAVREVIDPDVMGLQETKVHDDQFPLSAVLLKKKWKKKISLLLK